ncbi:hypothetical protein ACFLSZ_04205 [Candidatus Bipolaricaulota bacterium]
MRRLVYCLLVLSLAVLVGCDLFLPPIPSPNPNPNPPPARDADGPKRVLIEYQIDTIALRADIGDEPRTVVTSIGSVGNVVYEEAAHTLTCDTTVGDLLVQLWIFLDPTETIITYVKVRRIQSIGFGAWMRYDFLETDILTDAQIGLAQTSGNDKIFRVDQTTFNDFCDAVDTVEWREWRPDPPYSETQGAPFYRLKDPYSNDFHDCDDPGNYLEITLEYD